MPCGGIVTVAPIKVRTSWAEDCTYCGDFLRNDKAPDHYIEEWDSMVHGCCVRLWLETDEGACLQGHKHSVQIDGETIFEEGEDR